MIFFGKREVVEFITKWEASLSPEYAKVWKEFKEKRDIVIKKLGLSEKDSLFATAKELANFVYYDTKRKYNMPDLKAATKIRGNTRGFEIIEEMAKAHKQYGEKCAYFEKFFEEEMDKLSKKNNKR